MKRISPVCRKVQESNTRPVIMAFCPLDYRYGRQEFKHIWSELGRHERQLEVERALIWAHMQLGKVSKEDYDTENNFKFSIGTSF